MQWEILAQQKQGFLARKNIVFSAKRYGIDALGAMAQGLFASLLIGTIFDTLGQQLGIDFFVQVGAFAKTTEVVGAAMAVAIALALQAPPLVLFSMVTVGASANVLGGSGGPLAVLLMTVVAAECGKAVSKETKVDILVTPFVTLAVGVGLSMLLAPWVGGLADGVGELIEWATVQLSALLMGIIISVVVGVALHAAHFERRHLLSDHGPDGACRRRGGGRLLRPDGGLCRHELSARTAGAACCRRGWGPACCRWATSSKTHASGFRPHWPPPSRDPFPPACSR